MRRISKEQTREQPRGYEAELDKFEIQPAWSQVLSLLVFSEILVPVGDQKLRMTLRRC
jgi:hypothetical protein